MVGPSSIGVLVYWYLCFTDIYGPSHSYRCFSVLIPMIYYMYITDTYAPSPLSYRCISVLIPMLYYMYITYTYGPSLSYHTCPWRSRYGPWWGTSTCSWGRSWSTSATCSWTTSSGRTIYRITTRTAPHFRCGNVNNPLTSPPRVPWRHLMMAPVGPLVLAFSIHRGRIPCKVKTGVLITWPVDMPMV
jgi:hypothetical protein